MIFSDDDSNNDEFFTVPLETLLQFSSKRKTHLNSILTKMRSFALVDVSSLPTYIAQDIGIQLKQAAESATKEAFQSQNSKLRVMKSADYENLTRGIRKDEIKKSDYQICA